MSKRKIPLYRIYWDDDDVDAVASVVRRGSYWSSGPAVEELEREVTQYLGRNYAVSFNSGSSALQALLISYDFGENSGVAVPSFTFKSSVNSVILSGYKPIFYDIEEKYLGLDPEQLDLKSKVAAVLPTHYGGCPCRIDEIAIKSESSSVTLIEDAAESLGGEISSKGKVGSFGDSALFSFSGNKVVTSGEGGIIVTDSKRLSDRLRAIRSHGEEHITGDFRTELARDYLTLGCNWRMSDLTAALASSQFKKIEKLIEKRVKNSSYLSKKLGKNPELVCPTIWEDRRCTFQMYTIRVKNKSVRDGLREYLEKEGVSTKIYFEPLHKVQYYKRFGAKTGLKTTEDVSDRVLTLPMYPGMMREDMDYISEKVGTYLEGRD
jgi:perosamine synthetase